LLYAVRGLTGRFIGRGAQQRAVARHELGGLRLAVLRTHGRVGHGARHRAVLHAFYRYTHVNAYSYTQEPPFTPAQPAKCSRTLSLDRRRVKPEGKQNYDLTTPPTRTAFDLPGK
jgi:hypothetical protein